LKAKSGRKQNLGLLEFSLAPGFFGIGRARLYMYGGKRLLKVKEFRVSNRVRKRIWLGGETRSWVVVLDCEQKPKSNILAFRVCWKCI
jgi:hypothetical protein